MAQLNTLLSLNTAPTSRSVSPKAPSLQSDKRPPETPESAPSVTNGVNDQIPIKAEKTRFEKLLEEGKREQTDEQPPANVKVVEAPPAPAQDPIFSALGLFGGNPLPLEGQTLPPVAGAAMPEATVAAPPPTASGLTAAGVPGAAPMSLFASPQALPTLLDLDGPDPSLFGNSFLAGPPLQTSSTQPSASLFTDVAAEPLLAANDATLANRLFLTQTPSTVDGAVVPSGLQEIPGSTRRELTSELAGGLAAGLTNGVAKATPQPGAQPTLQPVLLASTTGVVPSAPSTSTSTDSGVDALTTVAQPGSSIPSAIPSAIQSAVQPESQLALSSDKVSAALAEAVGADVKATASAVLPQATVSDPAATAQAAAEPTNAQGQAVEIAWQPDAAERARAWRGIATLDSSGGLIQSAAQGLTQGLVQGARHEFSVNYTAAGQGGQLQQFAEALRQAGGAAEAGSQSILQTAAQHNATSTTAQTADRGTSVFNPSSPGPESQQAWRVDSAATGVTAAGSRGAAGTLSFAQGMQASSFGQPLGQSFGDSEWAESVTKRVALMAGQKVSSAQIELDPPELGAMTVRISVTGDQANVMFTSAHAQVREALEQTFTRLQDMLGQQGLQLAGAQVSDQSAARQQQGEGRSGQGGGGVFVDEGDAGPVTMQSLKVPKGLVDYYA